MKSLLFVVLTTLASVSVMASTIEPLDGRVLFQENCSRCHGENGKGGAVLPLVGGASKWTLKLFQRAVLTGVDNKGHPLKSPMPHWKDASFKADNGAAPTKAEIAAIYQYLRTVK